MMKTGRMMRQMTVRISMLAVMLFFIPSLMRAQSGTVAAAGQEEESWPGVMVSRLDSLFSSSAILKQVTMGFMVYDATSDSVLYARDESKLLRPASNEKLITGITALDFLGIGHQMRTSLCYSGEIRRDTVDLNITDSITGYPMVGIRSVLYGDLYGKGSFDPTFSRFDLMRMADDIRDLGIDSIAGNMYEDVSMKDSLRWGKGWCWDDGDSNPTLSPLLVERHSSFMYQLRDALSVRGIRFDGSIGSRVLPDTAMLVSEHVTTLSQVLPRMMKRSDNLYAESVFYQLGARSRKLYATADDSGSIINDMIKRLGYDPSSYRIVDGSGLSHYNNVSAELIIAFLRYARSHPAIYDPLISSLPVAGVDGTLSSRMMSSPAYRNVKAKTGTLNGVITLSGYCTSCTGHDLIFSILLSGVRSSLAARNFQDNICTILVHDGSSVDGLMKSTVSKPAPSRKARHRRKKRR